MFPRIEPELLEQVFFRSSFKDALERGRLSPAAFCREAGGELGLHIDESIFTPVWSSIFSEKKEITALLPQLQQRFTLILLSNTNKPHIDYITAVFPFLAVFKHRFYSYETGFLKPHPAAFTCVLEPLQLAPESVLFIDDACENVETARKLGLQAIQFQSDVQCMKELKYRRIL